MEVVFGGADVGLMGDVADSALKSHGKVIGVVPKSIAEKVGHSGLSAVHVVDTMHERKQLMFDLSDGFIALPGGLGTMEEMFELLTWAQLGQHSKPCGVLNTAGYWNKLLEFLDHCVEDRFIKPEHRKMLLVAQSPSELIGQFRNYEGPKVEKWIDMQRSS